MSDSINNYSGSAATLALLKPTVSAAQIRADRDRQLQYQALITQDAEQKKAQSQQAANFAQEAVSAMYNVPFLEQDQARWKDFVDGLLSENDKRMKSDYGDDPQQYAKERYQQDLQNLILKASKAPLLKQSLQRRSDVVKLMADQSKGLIDRPVTYRLTDGTVKTAPATQNYLDFQAGKTSEFTYGGGYQAPTKWNEYFSKTYHPNAASDPGGKFKPYRAGAADIAGAMLSQDGMNPADAADYLTRFGDRLPATYYKFDPRDPYKEEGIRQRNRGLAIAQQNANTASGNLKLKSRMLQGFNAYGVTLDPRNITTVDAQGTPVAVPATVYDGAKPDKNPWALVGYDGQLINSQLLTQIGIKQEKVKGGGVQLTPGNLGEVLVTAPNQAGGMDLRKTDLTGVRYQVVGAGDVFRRNMEDSEKTLYQKNGAPETLYQQITIRLTANDAIKARKNPLFRNIVGSKNSTGSLFGMTPNVDSEVGAGAYKVAGKDKEGQVYYDFTILKAVTPTAASRSIIESSPIGKWMDTKGGGSSLSDYNNEGAGPAYNIFDSLDNLDNE